MIAQLYRTKLSVALHALLALSLVLGVVAQRASGFLGPEWLTDPKTLLAAGTWVAYAAVVALHRNGVVFGRQQALAHCAVFGLVMFTWVGTPLLLGTPHP